MKRHTIRFGVAQIPAPKTRVISEKVANVLTDQEYVLM